MNRSLIAILSFLFAVLNIPSTFADNSQFVQRSGSQLYLNGEAFRFAGANIYWLGLDENVRDEFGNPHNYPTQFRIDNVLRTAHEMGANVVRSFAVLSVGCELCIQPSLGVFNEAAFESFDYAVKQAREYNIRFILPLVDNYHYYHGGRSTYTDWRGIPADNFYTNPAVIEDFKKHIAFVLNHVNPLTGLAYKDDPTIMAWETGNELQSDSAWAYTSWTREIADYIKSIAPNQLVADGHSALTAYATHLDIDSLALESVDMVSGHYYPLDEAFLNTDLEQARQAGKVFFIGEYDWTDTSGQRAQAHMMQDGQAALIDVTRASPIKHHVQLSYAPLVLSQGETYHLTFEARSSAGRDITVVLQDASTPFTEHVKQIIPITHDWQRYDVEFVAPVSSSNIRLSINLAGSTGQVWLNNFALNENTINNASFAAASATPTTGWAFSVIGNPGIVSLDEFLGRVENSPDIAGTLYWALFGHDDNYGYVQHNQVYTLHYPGDANLAPRTDRLRTHAYRMQNREVPPHSIPDAPLLYSVGHDENGTVLKWRGVVGASHYVIERSQDNGQSWEVVVSAVSDRALPYVDTEASPEHIYHYRVKAVNPDGAEGQYSAVVSTAELWENGSFEYRNQHWMAPQRLVTAEEARASITPDRDSHSGRYAAVVEVTQPGTHSSEIQLRQGNIPLQEKQRYRLSFWAKASSPQAIELVLKGDNSWSQTYDLTTDWREYTYDFEAAQTERAATLAFYLGRSTGKVWFDSVRLVRANASSSVVNR